MYRPDAFAEDRPDVLAALIAAHPLGLLITAGEDGPEANPVPFTLSEGGAVLRAHLARPNPQVAALQAAATALVVFQGEQAYVTPALYPTKAATGKVVPTWNYLMVQARGTPRVIEDAAWLRAQVDALTEAMEAGRADPWATADAPAGYMTAMLRGIVGVEIAVTTLAGKWKASQNRDAADRAGVAAGLAVAAPALAAIAGVRA